MLEPSGNDECASLSLPLVVKSIGDVCKCDIGLFENDPNLLPKFTSC